MKNIYLLLLLSLTLAQCQKAINKVDQIAQKQLDDCRQYDYCFKDSLMFYKGNQFELCGKIEDYIKVFGKYDRKVEELNPGGAKTIYYYFKNDKIGFTDLDQAYSINDPWEFRIVAELIEMGFKDKEGNCYYGDVRIDDKEYKLTERIALHRIIFNNNLMVEIV